jgi:hypothetical protein
VEKETTKLVALAFPDMTEYITRDGTMICVVSKALHGLIESAWLWYKECTTTFSSTGFNVIDADKGVVFKKTWTGQTLFASAHVDDFIASGSLRRSNRDDIDDELVHVLNSKYPGIVVQKGPKYRLLAYDIMYNQSLGRLEESQTTFILGLLDDSKLKGHERLPSRIDLLTSRTHINS